MRLVKSQALLASAILFSVLSLAGCGGAGSDNAGVPPIKANDPNSVYAGLGYSATGDKPVTYKNPQNAIISSADVDAAITAAFIKSGACQIGLRPVTSEDVPLTLYTLKGAWVTKGIDMQFTISDDPSQAKMVFGYRKTTDSGGNIAYQAYRITPKPITVLGTASLTFLDTVNNIAQVVENSSSSIDPSCLKDAQDAAARMFIDASGAK